MTSASSYVTSAVSYHVGGGLNAYFTGTKSSPYILLSKKHKKVKLA